MTGAKSTHNNCTMVNAKATGITTGSAVTLSFATLVHNGRNVTSGSMISFASVLTNSIHGDCSVSGSRTSHGYNFDSDGSCGFNQLTDHSHAGDPHLGALADNGGPTLTLLPQTGSPLINKVPATPWGYQSTDERGVARPQQGSCDIGAVEIAVLRDTASPNPTAPSPTSAMRKTTDRSGRRPRHRSRASIPARPATDSSVPTGESSRSAAPLRSDHSHRWVFAPANQS